MFTFSEPISVYLPGLMSSIVLVDDALRGHRTVKVSGSGLTGVCAPTEPHSGL